MSDPASTTQPRTPGAHETPADPELAADPIEPVDEMLIEEISIDGMCGVY